MPDARAGTAGERFVLLYALAWAGGTIGYTPLLTILLPARVAALAGKEAGVHWLAYVTLSGAVAASVGGIVFGYLSDRTRNRRGWMAGGLILSCLLLLAIGQVTSLAGLIALIICWQLALNMMLAPLAALAGDRVPDHHKGLLGGLMAFAPGMGALSGALVTQPGLAQGTTRLCLVAAMVVLCVLPVLKRPLPPSGTDHAAGDVLPDGSAVQRARRLAVIRMWIARLCLQVAEATLFAYLYFWLLTIDPTVSDNQTARLFSAIMLVSAPVALLVGRWSDRKDRPIAPLQACALTSALGLIGMSLAGDLSAAMLAYALFGLSSAVFLSLHSAQTLRLLPRPDRRGRDLGLFNLANTVPSLVMPWLAVTLIPVFGFRGLFELLAVLAGAAGLLLVALSRNG